MDGNLYQSNPNPVGLSDLRANSNEAMPPLAPSYKHSACPTGRDNYTNYYGDQQTVSRLMDSVNQGRMEDIRIGQQTMEICLEDVQIVNGAIEFRARMVPKPDSYLGNSYSSGYFNSTPNYKQPIHSYQDRYSGQSPYQPQYQPPYQSQYQPQYQQQYQLPYQYQSPYQSQYQSQYQLQYQSPYQLQSPYPNQILPPQYLPQFAYHYPYSNQIPAHYLYQYPPTNLVGGIANVISQLALTTMLRR